MDPIDQLVEKYGPAAVCEALTAIVTPERIARIDAILDQRLGSVVAVCEDTYDPHNAAAAIRTTEALGLQEMHVSTSRSCSTVPWSTAGRHSSPRYSHSR